MGGQDKGLQVFQGLPLAQCIVNKLQAQVCHVMINANRNQSAYKSFCKDVWPDDPVGFLGPLAGFMTGLAHCQTPYLMTVPCDTPLIPHDLCARLAKALSASNADVAMVRTLAPQSAHGPIVLRPQPVLTMIKRDLGVHLGEHLKKGGRKVASWAQELQCAWADFDQADDDPQAFMNLNTLEDLHALERTLECTIERQ
jgi:molybdopterin-guanine dinucleotide biosynthesis protein A